MFDIIIIVTIVVDIIIILDIIIPRPGDIIAVVAAIWQPVEEVARCSDDETAAVFLREIHCSKKYIAEKYTAAQN